MSRIWYEIFDLFWNDGGCHRVPLSAPDTPLPGSPPSCTVDGLTSHRVAINSLIALLNLLLEPSLRNFARGGGVFGGAVDQG